MVYDILQNVGVSGRCGAYGSLTVIVTLRTQEVGIGGGASVLVRVEYVGKDRQGPIVGVVYRKRMGVKTKGDEWEDVNLRLVATGNARHANDFEDTPAYSAAETAAKSERLGLWACAR